ncbi:MAG: hypothetical protein K6C12_09515 [Oscillospiraceae bacterium]|nr:hypothetical protein [Oscillospiraceae bacterium]
MSEVFVEDFMKLWERDLREEGLAVCRAEGEERWSQEIYECLRAANMPETQARAISFG